MLLRSNADLFSMIKALAGVNQFTSNEETMLISLTERRLNMAYNTSPMWDRYIVVSEERNLSSFKVSGITDNDDYNIPYYKYGTYVHTGNSESDVFAPIDQSLTNQGVILFYKNAGGKWVWGLAAYTKTIEDVITITPSTVFATQQDTDEYSSPTEVKDWGTLNTRTGNLIVTSKQIVGYNETIEGLSSSATARPTKTTINDFVRIHRKQAFLNDSTTEYQFFADSDGANVLNSSATGDVVFVTYKKNIANTTTGRILDSTTTFSTGSNIPSEFFNYTAHGVYADFLRMDGQHDKASFEEQKADMFLATELERIDIINNNNSLNHKFTTYINTSSR